MRAVMMMGLPGSGKNYYIKQNLANLLHISRDDIRKMLFINEYMPQHEHIVKQIMMDACKIAAACKLSIVINETLVNKNKRKLLLCDLKSMGYEEVDLVFINTPIEVCIERRDIPGGGTDWREVINDMNKMLEAPSRDEGFSKIITVESII